MPVSLRMYPANAENWLLPKDATCHSCGFDIYYGRKTVWPVSSGQYCKGQAARGREMNVGYLSGTRSCPNGCGREIVVTAPLIKEAQGLLWYVSCMGARGDGTTSYSIGSHQFCLLGVWGSSSFLRVGFVSGLFAKKIYFLVLIVGFFKLFFHTWFCRCI